MKIIFMGTPDFSVPTLDAIKKDGNEIVLVVTRPDKKKGRKGILTPPPVKEWAVKNNISIFQPVKLREKQNIEELEKYEADVIVVAAFGQILPKEVLDMPKYGCINVHASLLPKYRGASPIQWAILNGDDETGVTTMQMDIGLDDGDILLQKKVPISSEDTGGSLFDKLSKVGADLLIETLHRIEKNDIVRIPQDDEKATHVGLIKKDFGILSFDEENKYILNKIRALNPWPSAFTFYKDKMVKIWKAKSVSFNNKGYEYGDLVVENKDELLVVTRNGAISILELQEEGKKRIKAADFLRGHKIEKGDKFISK